MIGMVFDFNGTMFDDTQLHHQAWQLFLAQKTGRTLNDQEYLEMVHGRHNDAILMPFFPDADKAKRYDLAEEKEAIYRRLCIALPKKPTLVEGLPAFLNRLKVRKIPCTIATAACQSNVDFYVEFFGLRRWFDPAKIVCDDNIRPCKPAPDIYLRAAEVLGLPPSAITVFEDSPTGILAASRAEVGQIIALALSATEEELMAMPGVTACIQNYNNADHFLP